MSIIEELDAWLEERNKGKIKSVFFYNTKLVFYMCITLDKISVSAVNNDAESSTFHFDFTVDEMPEAKEILVFIAEKLLENAKSMMEASKEIQNAIFSD